MSEDNVVNVKHRMLELFSDMDEADIETIEQWISNQSYRKGKYFAYSMDKNTYRKSISLI